MIRVTVCVLIFCARGPRPIRRRARRASKSQMQNCAPSESTTPERRHGRAPGVMHVPQQAGDRGSDRSPGGPTGNSWPRVQYFFVHFSFLLFLSLLLSEGSDCILHSTNSFGYFSCMRCGSSTVSSAQLGTECAGRILVQDDEDTYIRSTYTRSTYIRSTSHQK